MSIGTVALKLFWFRTACPSTWFAQTEAQFALRGITADETKYYYEVAALDAATASRSLAVIPHPFQPAMHQPLQTFPNVQEKRETGERTSTNSPSAGPQCFAATRPTSATSESKMTQLFVTDERSKRRFLVDTDAQVSVTPATWADKVSGATGPNLQAANGSSIATYGSRVVHLHLGNRVFDARLISANVKRPLLGADFLRQHNLLVDIRGRRLIEADSFSHINCSVSSVSNDSDLALIEPNCNSFWKILNGYPELLQPTFSTAEVKHGVKHFIPTKDRPVFARARHLAPDKLASAKREFFRNGEDGYNTEIKQSLGIPSAHDDILVASSSTQSHIDDLNAVFHRLRHHGLVIKLEKCLFGVSSLDFLGHQVPAAGSVPMPPRVSAVKDFPQPRDVKALQEFLGIMNFYHHPQPRLNPAPPLPSHKHIQTASRCQLDQ
ncbi:retrovirus-related pol polyprotein [Plakobranchus ocellatus]|uniref:Retrovirus-related pol polyprotein n=1 Tax=Plakobranchus ocellatus TaxID=259542 RepID=A0AAV4DZE8_9GAST|nr:retrovirus-related pol polyprotein [Plakobranchus ocellatus]